MYEHHKKPLISRIDFARRMLAHAAISSGLVIISLCIGMAGYHWISGLSWTDSILNASMILTGMGPVSPMPSDGAKLFASFYALYSGIAFLSMIAIISAPILHRFLHRFHLEDEDT